MYFSFLLSSVKEFAAKTNIRGTNIIGVNTVEGGLSPSGHDTPKSSQSTNDKIDAGTAAGVMFGVTAFVGLAIAVIVIGWRRRKSVNRKCSDLTVPLQSLSEYGAVSEEGKTRI